MSFDFEFDYVEKIELFRSRSYISFNPRNVILARYRRFGFTNVTPQW